MRKFTLELNAAKNIDYIEKCFKQKLHRIKFLKKKNSLKTSSQKEYDFTLSGIKFSTQPSKTFF